MEGGESNSDASMDLELSPRAEKNVSGGGVVRDLRTDAEILEKTDDSNAENLASSSQGMQAISNTYIENIEPETMESSMHPNAKTIAADSGLFDSPNPFLAICPPASVSTGVLVPLKTTMETRARERTVEVWVTVIGVRMASGALILTRKLVPDDGGLNLQHLRRFAKFDDVPESVRDTFLAAKASSSSEEIEGGSHETRGSGPQFEDDRLLVVGSINAITHDALISSLQSIIPDPAVFTIHVPLLAPTSQEQASRWTAQYWPTVYKKSNPFGPHPSIVSRAQGEIRDDAGKYMELAERVAKQSCDKGFGERIGVVVVERKEGKARVVAVAGDARWVGWERDEAGCGNVTAHAAMRAIGMVAEGLRQDDQGASADEDPSSKIEDAEISTTELNRSKGTSEVTAPLDTSGVLETDEGQKTVSTQIKEIFQDKPLLPIEEENLSLSGNGTGYLCHELEIYGTHEPCVMCSMAIVHSRFGRVVFARQMQETGGLCADGELSHGLFWRKELNWTMLAWHWHHPKLGMVEDPFMHA